MPYGRRWRRWKKWPGFGPFCHLPPWERPGWIFRGACWWLPYWKTPSSSPLRYFRRLWPTSSEDEVKALEDYKKELEEEKVSIEEELREVEKRIKELREKQ